MGRIIGRILLWVLFLGLPVVLWKKRGRKKVSNKIDKAKRDTLLEYADKYCESPKPKTMVDHWEYVLLSEAYKVLREENNEFQRRVEDLTERINDLTGPPKKEKNNLAF